MAIIKTVVMVRPNPTIPVTLFDNAQSTYYQNLINNGLFSTTYTTSPDRLTVTQTLRFETQADYDTYLNDTELTKHRSDASAYWAANGINTTVSVSTV